MGRHTWHWGRLGAMVSRACHYSLGHRLAMWLLLFADDLLALAESGKLDQSFPILIFTILIFGGPGKWTKFKGGLHFHWIGYWLDMCRIMVGISLKRREWVLDWSSSVLAQGSVDRHQGDGRVEGAGPLVGGERAASEEMVSQGGGGEGHAPGAAA